MNTHFDDLATKTKNAEIKKKILYLQSKQKKEDFSMRNKILKAKNQFDEQEAEKLDIQYCQMYFWCYVLRVYKCQRYIKQKFMLIKGLADSIRHKEEMARRIQRTYRFKLCLMSNKTNSDRKLVFQTLNVRAFHIRKIANKHAIYAVGIFFKQIVPSMKYKKISLDFVQQIKNMQRRVRKHVQARISAIAQIQHTWTNNVIRLNEIQDELRDMGIKINMNDLDKIDPEFRRNMCDHIVDRQLIQFTDTRYEKIMKDTDIQNAKRAEKFTKNKKLGIKDMANFFLKLGQIDSGRNSATQSKINSHREIDVKRLTDKSVDLSEASNVINQTQQTRKTASFLKISDNLEQEVLDRIDIIDADRDARISSRRVIQQKNCDAETKKTANLQFDAERIQYNFTSGTSWKILESTDIAKFFRIAAKKAPEISELRKKYVAKKRAAIEERDKQNVEMPKNKTFNRQGTMAKIDNKFRRLQNKLGKSKKQTKEIEESSDEESSDQKKAIAEQGMFRSLRLTEQATFNCEVDDNLMMAVIINAMDHFVNKARLYVT